MKENVKPCAYKLSEVPFGTDGVPIEECAGDLLLVARLSCKTEPERKRVLIGR